MHTKNVDWGGAFWFKDILTRLSERWKKCQDNAKGDAKCHGNDKMMGTMMGTTRVFQKCC